MIKVNVRQRLDNCRIVVEDASGTSVIRFETVEAESILYQTEESGLSTFIFEIPELAKLDVGLLTLPQSSLQDLPEGKNSLTLITVTSVEGSNALYVTVGSTDVNRIFRLHQQADVYMVNDPDPDDPDPDPDEIGFEPFHWTRYVEDPPSPISARLREIFHKGFLADLQETLEEDVYDLDEESLQDDDEED